MSRGQGIFSFPSLFCVLSAIVEHAGEFFFFSRLFASLEMEQWAVLGCALSLS